MARKLSTTVYLSPEQLDRLKVLSERTGVSAAEWIRRGINLRLGLPAEYTVTRAIELPARAVVQFASPVKPPQRREYPHEYWTTGIRWRPDERDIANPASESAAS